MRTIYYSAAIVPLLSLASARAVHPLEAIANLARLKKRDDPNAPVVPQGVDIQFFGCDGINPKTGHKKSWDITNAWDGAIDIANAIKEIDTNSDIGAYDYFGPNMQTEGIGYKVLSVYNNLGSFGRNFFWGWRVNAFCEPEDANLHRGCPKGHFAYEWNTLCKDGRCPCDERNEKGDCIKQGKDGFNSDPDKSYINIMFCDSYFAFPSLKEVVESGKNKPKEQKYNMDTYWDNRDKVLFHELLHGATVGAHANDKIGITDLWIKVKQKQGDGTDKIVDVVAYGPLNAKLLARTIRNDNWNDYVRKNDDNWTGYALGKYINKEVGVYPILPLADDHVYSQGGDLPNALFLTGANNDFSINANVYNKDNLFKWDPNNWTPQPGVEKTVVEGDKLSFRPAKDYPDWYIKHIEAARNGNFDGQDQPQQPQQPPPPPPPSPPPPGPPNMHKSLQVFWEVEPHTEPGPIVPHMPPTRIQKPKYWWYFYSGELGKGADPCKEDPINVKGPMYPAPAGNHFPVVINGEWEIDVPGLGKCKYQGIGRVGPSGDNGWLHCDGRPAILCKPDERPEDECKSDTTIKSKAISLCEY